VASASDSWTCGGVLRLLRSDTLSCMHIFRPRVGGRRGGVIVVHLVYNYHYSVEGYFEMVTFHVCPYTWRIGLNYDLHFGLTLENFGPWAINVLILVVRNWAVTRDEMLNPPFFFFSNY